MQQALRHEAEYFDEKKRLLLAIFNETLAQSSDAYRSKNVPKDKFQEMCLKSDDERYIRSMIVNPISIVLMGNRPCVKARIANYILGHELLPVFDLYDPDYNQARRSVRIIYGSQRCQAFCIRHFECQPLHTKRVSFDDLRLNPVEGGGNGSGNGNNTANTANTNLGHNECGSSSSSLAEPLSMTTSGHGSFTDGTSSSSSPSTISLSSSASLKSSHPPTSGASSSAFSSHHHHHHHASRRNSLPNDNRQSRYSSGGADEDDEDDDLEDDLEDEYFEVNTVNEMTILEIVLPHELLEKNLQIRIAPDVDNFDVIYKSTFHKTNPIIMYCFERYDDKLSETDVAHLDQLRQLMPSTPILFAHIVDFDPTYHTCLAPTKLYSSPHLHTHPYFNHLSSPAAASHQPSTANGNSSINTEATSAISPIGSPSSAAHHQHISSQTTTTITSPQSCFNCKHSELTESEQQKLQDDGKVGGPVVVDGDNTTCSSCNHLSTTAQTESSTKPACCANKKSSSTTSETPSGPNEQNSSLSEQQQQQPSNTYKNGNYLRASERLRKQLCDLGFFQETAISSALQALFDRQQKRITNGYHIINDRPCNSAKQNANYGIDVRSRFLCHSYEFCYFVDFFRSILKSNMVVALTLLNEIHNQLIQYFIFTAFDMTWSLNYCIPKRLEYAWSKEAELYMSLMGIANRKQDEIQQLIGEVVGFMREDILEQASNYVFLNPNLSKNTLVSANNLKDCIDEIQEFVFVMLNRAIAVKLISSVDVMQETFIGTLQRCLAILENSRPETDSDKLRQEEKIDFAFNRLLDSAYSIEISVNTCNSILRIFWQRLKQFFAGLTFAWRPSALLNAEWKRKVAADLIDNLSEAKLAKCICTQFREKLKVAHENFVHSLHNLESVLHYKMKDTDNRLQQVRKKDAPLFARLALESTSLIDAILCGVPELSKEVGRGQYGVVFSTKKSWAHYSRIAVKSIMIRSDKHWNDLAMEFYYARSLPENDRIVQIRGSIIEHNYNGSSNSYVYLIMERLTRDLYAGLKAGLDWLLRLQISLDVVQGIRFLHNHGLIHRDIKLKNVLLDRFNRAKITDLGFCKSEVMISGSIVGTPIHMAPEVFTGKYDSMVDVYAFGILFWYICAGSVELPQVFKQCHNKDHVWTAVMKGLRPERLPVFDDTCYQLMERCWAGDPTRRPLLGEVEQILVQTMERYSKASSPSFSKCDTSKLLSTT